MHVHIPRHPDPEIRKKEAAGDDCVSHMGGSITITITITITIPITVVISLSLLLLLLLYIYIY